MWNNCMNRVDRLWMTRRACAFVETPCFALLCLLTVRSGRAGRCKADPEGVNRSLLVS